MIQLQIKVNFYYFYIKPWHYDTIRNDVSKKNFILYKSIEFGMPLKYSVTLNKQKQKFCSLPSHWLAEKLIVVVSFLRTIK